MDQKKEKEIRKRIYKVIEHYNIYSPEYLLNVLGFGMKEKEIILNSEKFSISLYNKKRGIE